MRLREIERVDVDGIHGTLLRLKRANVLGLARRAVVEGRHRFADPPEGQMLLVVLLGELISCPDRGLSDLLRLAVECLVAQVTELHDLLLEERHLLFERLRLVLPQLTEESGLVCGEFHLRELL